MPSKQIDIDVPRVPIEGPSILLGDNESVVKSATTPRSKLGKRHLIFFWHYLRQAITTDTYDYDVHIPGNIGDLTQYHNSFGMSDQEEKLTTRLQVHSRVTGISDREDFISHVRETPNPSDDGKYLNIPHDGMAHDLRRDSIQHDSTQRIFEESGENIMWTWPIVTITTAQMEKAQDYRSSWRDMTSNTMTRDDGERINSYPENNPGGILQVSHWIYIIAVAGILRFIVEEGDANGKNDDVPVDDVIESNGSPDKGDPRSSIPIGTENILNHWFLLRAEEDGSQRRAFITGIAEAFQGQLDSDPTHVQCKARIGDNNFEELVQYNDLMKPIEEQQPLDDGTWKFRNILAHREPRNEREKWHVLIEWESGERTWEPIDNIYDGEKYILAEYAQDHGLLDEWESPRMKIKDAAKKARLLVT